MDLIIKKADHKDKTPMELLFQADPSEDMINKYLFAGDMYLAKLEEEVVGVFIIMPNTEDEMELKNISIAKPYQGLGYGKEIINYAIRIAKMDGFKYLVVKTADIHEELIEFYKKLKFRDYFTIKGHFIKYYNQPILENGRQATDQIVLRRKL